MQNYSSLGSHLKQPLFLRGRRKAVYILLSLDPTLALLWMGFTEYDDDDDDDDDVDETHFRCSMKCWNLLIVVIFNHLNSRKQILKQDWGVSSL
ncbi:hypothetical protein Hanom_Chr05g00474071 [Helianthus anomalus]